MSDDAIERGYEEQLKSDTGYRELWVRFVGGEDKRVRTFPDTDEWCEAADRLAFELLGDPEVEKVWSTPMGAGTRAASVDSGQPAPLRCCTPVRSIGPSGLRLRHDWDCKLRGQIFEEPGTKIPWHRPDRIARRHAMETRRVGLDDGIPADRWVGVLTATGPECPAHPSFGVDDCPVCSDRRI